jgi:biotin carboxylase
MTKTLTTIADIKRHFAQCDVPHYFISATNFNLMGMHDWIKNWHNVNLIDCYDGQHPRVLLIEDDHSRVFESIEDINLYLLNHHRTQGLLTRQSQTEQTRGRAVFLFFDEQIEALCKALNLDIVLPKNSLVREIDSKIVTTELGNEAGVLSVPNVLAQVTSYTELQRIARDAGLGERWVVQTAYGDSGKTTFFIASEADYQKAAEEIESEDRVKVMRWVKCTGTAIEACATRWGTFVGPLLTELIGIPELTPYPGGWCGNELYDAAFSADVRRQVQEKTEALGNALYRRGYRGYFELDYLIDQDSGEVYLGELNARITGISAMTNMADFSIAQVPLFLFHLLEYDPDIDLQMDISAFNQAVLAQGAMGTAAQVILKYTDAPLKIITAAPASGVYVMSNDGHLSLQRAGTNRREALAENQAYILRIMTTGEYAYKGGDLAIMFVNQIIRSPEGRLNPAGEQWGAALKNAFSFRQLTHEERSAVELANNPANIKGGRAS